MYVLTVARTTAAAAAAAVGYIILQPVARLICTITSACCSAFYNTTSADSTNYCKPVKRREIESKDASVYACLQI